MKNLLLTGRPGVGKTTVIQRVLAMLSRDVRATGFYTQELRGPQGRLGFIAITLAGQQHTLAHVDFRDRHRVSRYGVDVTTFEAHVVPTIDPARHPDASLIVVDEIGKMECFSEVFRETVTRALDSPVPVLATIALKGNTFIQGIRSRKDVELIEVTVSNRDELPARLVRVAR